MAAKQAERTDAANQAKAYETKVRNNLQDFSAKDTSMFGWDPEQSDITSRAQEIEALTQLYRKAGMSDPEIEARISDLLRSTLTSGGRTDLNAGPSEAILKQFNVGHR
jgi:ABC-type uncharacterized transport system ATPase subunit